MFVFAFFTPAVTPTVCCSLVRHRAGIQKRDQKPRQRRHFPHFATVTVLAFAGFLDALRARLSVSPIFEASSIRQGDGQRFQKKAMKTTNQKIEASAPANVRPSYSVSKTGMEAQDGFVKHCENRRLPTETVLNHLRTQFPKQYERAEVVGKWIWLALPTKKQALAFRTSATFLLPSDSNRPLSSSTHFIGMNDASESSASSSLPNRGLNSTTSPSGTDFGSSKIC